MHAYVTCDLYVYTCIHIQHATLVSGLEVTLVHAQQATRACTWIENETYRQKKLNLQASDLGLRI